MGWVLRSRAAAQCPDSAGGFGCRQQGRSARLPHPVLVVSPFAKREHVSSIVLDHTSILSMIEWRWGLEPLTVRDATANNLAEVLQFARPDFAAKQLDVPSGPFGQLCVPGVPDETDDEWLPLLARAAEYGWPVRLPVTL